MERIRVSVLAAARPQAASAVRCGMDKPSDEFGQ